MKHILFKIEKLEHVTRISNFSNMKMILSFKPEGRKYKINHFLVIVPDSFVICEYEIDFKKTYISFEE